MACVVIGKLGPEGRGAGKRSASVGTRTMPTGRNDTGVTAESCMVRSGSTAVGRASVTGRLDAPALAAGCPGRGVAARHCTSCACNGSISSASARVNPVAVRIVISATLLGRGVRPGPLSNGPGQAPRRIELSYLLYFGTMRSTGAIVRPGVFGKTVKRGVTVNKPGTYALSIMTGNTGECGRLARIVTAARIIAA